MIRDHTIAFLATQYKDRLARQLEKEMFMPTVWQIANYLRLQHWSHGPMWSWSLNKVTVRLNPSRVEKILLHSPFLDGQEEECEEKATDYDQKIAEAIASIASVEQRSEELIRADIEAQSDERSPKIVRSSDGYDCIWDPSLQVYKNLDWDIFPEECDRLIAAGDYEVIEP